MKKVIFAIFASVVLYYGCNSEKAVKDKRIEQIESLIDKKALGMDIGFQPGTLDTEKIVTVKMAIDNYEASLEYPIDTLIDYFTGVFEKAQKENDKNTYHVWKYQVERMKRLKTMSPSDVDYSVYKYSYTIKHLMDSTKRYPITNYYFFNYQDSLVAYYDDEDMKELKHNNIGSEIEPFEVGIGNYLAGFKSL